jgi:hypothetical protein
VLGRYGVQPVTDRVEVAEQRVGHHLHAGGPRRAGAQQPGTLDLRQVGQRGEQLAAEGLRDLLGHLERREVAQRPASPQGIRPVGIDPGGQEGQHARGDLDLGRGAWVHHHPLLGGIGALEQVARTHPHRVTAGRAEVGQRRGRAEGSNEPLAVLIGPMAEGVGADQPSIWRRAGG